VVATDDRIFFEEYYGTDRDAYWDVQSVRWTATRRSVRYGGQLIRVIPRRDLVVVTTTEVRLGDPASQGISQGVLLDIVEYAIVAQFPAG
jgi:hypothetical protein